MVFHSVKSNGNRRQRCLSLINNMNTTASLSSDHSWSRRCSTESVYSSIQGKETDIARDTSDTDAASDNTRDGSEYEPITDDDHEAPVDANTDTSAQSDNDIITTKVIEVSVGDDRDMVFADSEQTDSLESDSETDLYDFWHCAQCRAINNNPLYSYCRKCFEVRKNFFPPRPKRKRKKATKTDSSTVPRTLSQDSGVDTFTPSQWSQDTDPSNPEQGTSKPELPIGMSKKRRAVTPERKPKRKRYSRTDSETDLDSDDVKPIQKTTSDPAITIDDSDPLQIPKKVIANTLKEIESKDLCVMCVSEPKSGVFVHGRIAHICCCYKCAVKVWAKTKRCPLCNCKVSNVLKAVVM